MKKTCKEIVSNEIDQSVNTYEYPNRINNGQMYEILTDVCNSSAVCFHDNQFEMWDEIATQMSARYNKSYKKIMTMICCQLSVDDYDDVVTSKQNMALFTGTVKMTKTSWIVSDPIENKAIKRIIRKFKKEAK